MYVCAKTKKNYDTQIFKTFVKIIYRFKYILTFRSVYMLYLFNIYKYFLNRNLFYAQKDNLT